MSLKERTINVDIMTKEYTKLKYKQGDSNQILKFKFYKNGSELDLTGYVAGIFYEKPNNEVLEKTGNISSNTVTTTITSGVLNTPGVVKTEIFLTKNDEVSISFTILIEVESSIDKTTAVQEKEEWDAIKDLLIKANNLAMIDDNSAVVNTTWSSYKINSQIKEMAKKTSVENGILYLLKSDGTKIDTGTEIPIANVTDEQLTTIINRLIADGTLAALTIGDGSITYEKLSNDVKDKIENSTNSFSSWLAIGDSITVGYSNDLYSYADILAEKYNIYLTKDAITGTHISTNSDNFGKSFANRYMDNGDDYNLVTVVGGINDWMHGVELGTFDASATTTDTFYNGLNVLVKGLLTKYPNSKIVFFTSNINNNTSTNGTTGLKFEDYANAMKTVCNYYSVPFYPIHLLCGFNGLTTYDLNSNTLNADKTHPLTPGHMKIADAISNCINFINPLYGYGKGTLNITSSTSSIPAGASPSEIKNCLIVTVEYENGITKEIQNYTVEGTIVENVDSTLTIKYRNLSNDFVVKGGSPSGAYTPLFQLTSPINIGESNKVVDLGYAPFNEASPRTIKAIFNVDNATTVGVPLLRAWSGNANTYCGISINAAGTNKRIGITTTGGVNTMLMASTTASDYLIYPNNIELFITWDGASAISMYVVDNSGIKWSKTITGTVSIGDYTLKFGYEHTSRYWTGTLSTLNVYDTAFTEQDVLNNI